VGKVAEVVEADAVDVVVRAAVLTPNKCDNAFAI